MPLPPTDVTPYNATLNANWTNLNPGSNVSSFYQYGDCNGFPAGALTTPVQVTTSASGSGSLPPFTVGGLEPSTQYCVGVCMEDSTAQSGFICSTSAFTFGTPKAPETITLPATNVGVGNTSTLKGEFNSFVPGETLEYYHLLAPCVTYNQSAEAVGNGTIPNNPGNGTLPPSTVGPLQAGTEYCYKVFLKVNCVLALDSMRLTTHCHKHTRSALSAWQATSASPSAGRSPCSAGRRWYVTPEAIDFHQDALLTLYPTTTTHTHIHFEQFAVADNASDITPTSAVLSGSYGDLPPGHTISYYYSWGLCESFPNTSTSSNVSTLPNPGPSGELPSYQIVGLVSNAEYCVQVDFAFS